MTPKKPEQDRREGDQEPGLCAWGPGQEDWFGAPGDVDDFIFYDALGEGYGDEEWPHASSK